MEKKDHLSLITTHNMFKKLLGQLNHQVWISMCSHTSLGLSKDIFGSIKKWEKIEKIVDRIVSCSWKLSIVFSKIFIDLGKRWKKILTIKRGWGRQGEWGVTFAGDIKEGASPPIHTHTHTNKPHHTWELPDFCAQSCVSKNFRTGNRWFGSSHQFKNFSFFVQSCFLKSFAKLQILRTKILNIVFTSLDWF